MDGGILSDALKGEKRGDTSRTGEETMEQRRKRLSEKGSSGGMFDFIYKKRRESESEIDNILGDM